MESVLRQSKNLNELTSAHFILIEKTKWVIWFQLAQHLESLWKFTKLKIPLI